MIENVILGSWTLTRKQILVTGVLVAGLLVVVARWAAVLGAPKAEPAAAAARDGTGGPAGRTSAGRLVVHVVGAVRRPGLYRLDQGERIADALARAGGATRRADLELVNLAAPITDGQQVVVPRRQPPAATAGPGREGAADPGSRQAGPIHLNTATLADLDALAGVGPVTAQKILDYRQEHGAFSSVDELDAVPGIGPARLEELRKVVVP